MSFRYLFVAVAVVGLSLCGGARAQTSDTVDLFERASLRVEDREQHLVELRHDIHRNPDLSGSEARTARLVARRLAALGFDVRTGVGGHGVVGVLVGGRPGPTVAFRADMDAIPTFDEDPVDYHSTVPGVRHGCGHDMHTAIGVALAEGFAAVQADLPGTVMLVFQPAEEAGTGANAMLRDGVFETVRPDAMFAVHTFPVDLGTVSTAARGLISGRASVSVTARGEGDVHEAASAVRAVLDGVNTVAPHLAVSLMPEGYAYVELVPSDRELPDGSRMVQGQIMTLGPDDRDRVEAVVRDALASIDVPGVALDVAYDARFMEGVTNTPTLVEDSNAGIRALAPEVAVAQVRGAYPAFSEDFGSFLTQAPGVMYFLGVNNPETGAVGFPHSPDFVADDGAILIGTRVMLAAMLVRLTAG